MPDVHVYNNASSIMFLLSVDARFVHVDGPEAKENARESSPVGYKGV